MTRSFPVYATVGNQRVRIGTAHEDGDGFSLALGGLRIGGEADAMAHAPSAQRQAAGGDPGAFGGGSGPVFPNFGRAKGQPIMGAAKKDLDFYASCARKSLADPSKARWHEKEERLLHDIEAELHRQGFGHEGPGEGYTPPQSPPSDDDIPF